MGEILKELAGPAAAYLNCGHHAQAVFIRMCDKAVDYTGKSAQGTPKARRGLFTQKRANLAQYIEGDSSKVHNLSRPIQKLIECGLIERLDRGQGPVLKANEFLEGSKYNSVLISWKRIGEDYESWLRDSSE